MSTRGAFFTFLEHVPETHPHIAIAGPCLRPGVEFVLQIRRCQFDDEGRSMRCYWKLPEGASRPSVQQGDLYQQAETGIVGHVLGTGARWALMEALCPPCGIDEAAAKTALEWFTANGAVGEWRACGVALACGTPYPAWFPYRNVPVRNIETASPTLEDYEAVMDVLTRGKPGRQPSMGDVLSPQAQRLATIRTRAMLRRMREGDFDDPDNPMNKLNEPLDSVGDHQIIPLVSKEDLEGSK